MEKTNNNFDKLINHLKSVGFVFQGSEIYGGLANSWDYGPLGVELKNNIKKMWWDFFVHKNKYNFGLDSSIILNPSVWKASGHIGNFNDPLIDCKSCNSRWRADKLIENKNPGLDVGGWDNKEIEAFIKENKIECPSCSKTEFTSIRNFELMFKTNQGVIESESNSVYLRPETAQGIFINYKNVVRSTRKKLPIGIGQIGKSFRNEITPGNFIFRTREFEQMELEFFFNPSDQKDWFEYWFENINDFLLNKVKLKKDNLVIREHSKKELAHYSNRTVDFEYMFPFGKGELWGLAHRGDFDLKSHQDSSGQNLEYLDIETNTKFLPHVIEPSVGVERLLLAILCDSYCEEKISDSDERIVLKLPKSLSPYSICVLPLQKQQKELASKVYDILSNDFNSSYDESGNIGKRYRRQDSIGTPYCVTVDFESLENNKVTVRDRDSMQQVRVDIDKLSSWLFENLKK